MEINYEKLLDFSGVDLKDDGSEIDEIIEYEEILFEISDSFKKYRKENKMTQKQLAKVLDMDQVMVSKLESGNYNPTFKQLHRISRKLTNSGEFFIKILKNIINNINHLYKLEYNLKFKRNDFVEKKTNVFYINNIEKYKIKTNGGIYESEECTSMFSNAG